MDITSSSQYPAATAVSNSGKAIADWERSFLAALRASDKPIKPGPTNIGVNEYGVANDPGRGGVMCVQHPAPDRDGVALVPASQAIGIDDSGMGFVRERAGARLQSLSPDKGAGMTFLSKIEDRAATSPETNARAARFYVQVDAEARLPTYRFFRSETGWQLYLRVPLEADRSVTRQVIRQVQKVLASSEIGLGRITVNGRAIDAKADPQGKGNALDKLF